MKHMARGVAVRIAAAVSLSLLFVGLTLACGSVARPSAASPSPSPGAASSPGGQTVTALTDADLGRTLQLRRGEVVSVSLHESSGFTPWSRPVSTDGSVLAPVPDARAAAVRGATLASFRGVGAGTAQITSSASQACTPGSVCPALARGWSVTVVVG
jgi:hypothetical protein